MRIRKLDDTNCISIFFNSAFASSDKVSLEYLPENCIHYNIYSDFNDIRESAKSLQGPKISTLILGGPMPPLQCILYYTDIFNSVDVYMLYNVEN